MTTFFVTRTGRRVPEAETDQAGSDMLVRTVSRYADGTAIDRPQLCAAPELFAGDIAIAATTVDDWDRRGYLPPARPMTRAEFDRLPVAVPQPQNPRKFIRLSDGHRRIVWEVLGRGVPLALAITRCGAAAGKRRDLQRLIKALGWDQQDDQ